MPFYIERDQISVLDSITLRYIFDKKNRQDICLSMFVFVCTGMCVIFRFKD